MWYTMSASVVSQYLHLKIIQNVCKIEKHYFISKTGKHKINWILQLQKIISNLNTIYFKSIKNISFKKIKFIELEHFEKVSLFTRYAKEKHSDSEYTSRERTFFRIAWERLL